MVTSAIYIKKKILKNKKMVDKENKIFDDDMKYMPKISK